MTKVQFASSLSSISRLSKVTQSVSHAASRTVSVAKSSSTGEVGVLGKSVRVAALAGVSALAMYHAPPVSNEPTGHRLGRGFQIAGVVGGLVGASLVLGGFSGSIPKLVQPRHIVGVGVAAGVGASLVKTGISAQGNQDKLGLAERKERLEEGIGVLEYTKSDTPYGESVLYKGEYIPEYSSIAESTYLAAGRDTEIVLQGSISGHDDVRDAIRAMRDDDSTGAVLSYRQKYIHVELSTIGSDEIKADRITKKTDLDAIWEGGRIVALESNNGDVFEGSEDGFYLVEKFVGE